MGEGFLRLVSIQEAEAIIKANVPMLEGFEVTPLMDASSRILYENLYAPIDLPPFDRALMDGYAVMAADTFRASEEEGVTLKVRGSLRAGSVESIVITSGEAVEIATGAPIPEGADAVIMVEQTEKGEDDIVTIYGSVAPGENIQARGSDIRKGELLFP